jgi:hypothetical protein
MNNNLQEIKILVSGLLQDIESVENTDNLPIYKWEDIMISLDIIKHKLNTYKNEYDRRLLKEINEKLVLLDDVLKGGYVTPVGKDEFEEVRRVLDEERETENEQEQEPENEIVPESGFMGESPEVKDEADDLPTPEYERKTSPVKGFTDLFSSPEEIMPVSSVEEEPFELFSDSGESILDAAQKKRISWMNDNPGTRINDINQGISFNDKVLFLNELFYGDSDQYRLSLARLNELRNLDEAIEYLRAAFPDWDESSDTVYRFYMIIRRKLDV